MSDGPIPVSTQPSSAPAGVAPGHGRAGPTGRAIPWRMRFPGPVFAKEVWILGKRPSTAWLRLTHVAVLLFVVGMVFMNMSTSYASGAAAQLQRYQELAPFVTMAIVWVEFVMLVLVAVALASPAVCEEKRMGTLGTLLTTPLHAWQIVLGKGLGRLVELLILALVPLPLLLAIRSFGGVTAEAVVTMTVTCIVNAVLAVQVGLFVSTLTRRTTAAMTMSLVLVGAVFFLPSLAMWLMAGIRNLVTGSSAPPGAGIQAATVMTSAPFMLGAQSLHLLFGQSMGLAASFPVFQLWLIHVGYTLALWAVFFWLSCLALRRAMAMEAAGAKPGTGRRQSRKKPDTAPSPAALGPDTPAVAGESGLTVPIPRRGNRRRAAEGSSRTVGDAPVVWRELQQTIVRSRVVALIAALLVGGFLAFVYYMTGFGGHIQTIVTAIGAPIVLIACAVLSTGSIAQERESRTLDALLCTPLSAWDIVWGKFLGALRRASVGLALILLHVLVSGVCAIPGGAICEVIDTVFPKFGSSRSINPEMTHPIAILHVAMTLGSSMVFLLATGILFSARLKKSTSATVCNIALAIALWAALPAFVFVMTETVWDFLNGVGDNLQDFVLAMNPVPAAVIAVEGATGSSYAAGGGMRSDLSYDLPNGNWGPVAFTIVTTIIGLAYLTGAWFALRLAAHTLAAPTSRKR